MSKQNVYKMFRIALFIIDIRWKYPKCLSSYKWINKLWHSYMEYYVGIKKNEVPVYANMLWTQMFIAAALSITAKTRKL